MAKLEAVEKELKLLAPDIETLIIQADFTGNANLEFYKEIVEKVEDRDIGLVILNAGIGTMGGIEDKNPATEIQPILDTNVYQVALLMKLFLPSIANGRKSGKAKSGVIVTSSIAAYNPKGKGNLYSGSKIFCNFLTHAVEYELRKSGNRVDMMTLNPGFVHTTMTAPLEHLKLPGFTTADWCVYKTLKDLGRERETFGVFKHEAIAYMVKVMNHWGSLGRLT